MIRTLAVEYWCWLDHTITYPTLQKGNVCLKPSTGLAPDTRSLEIIRGWKKMSRSACVVGSRYLHLFRLDPARRRSAWHVWISCGEADRFTPAGVA
jgi:hypothetical protein